MVSILLNREMAMSLRLIFDLAFAASFLTLRGIVVRIARAGVTSQYHASKRELRALRAVWVHDSHVGRHQCGDAP